MGHHHDQARMFTSRISVLDSRVNSDIIKHVIQNGSIIKEYPEDTPYPSRLILGYEEKRPVHVVSAYNPADDTEYVITAYKPDLIHWSENFTERR